VRGNRKPHKPKKDHPWRGYARMGTALAKRKAREHAAAEIAHFGGTGSCLENQCDPTAPAWVAETIRTREN